MMGSDTSTSGSDQFGPADVTCPYCGEVVHVEAGPTKLAEVTHCNDRWIIVDLERGKAGHTKKYATDGGEPQETGSEQEYADECPYCGTKFVGMSPEEFRREHAPDCNPFARLYEWPQGDENGGETA